MLKKVILTKEQERCICDAFMSGLSATKIVKKFNLGWRSVLCVLHENNMFYKYKESRKDRICSLYLEGRSVEEIYKIEKISYQLISKYLNERNIKLRHYRKHSELTEEDEKEIVRLYIEEGWTKDNVARKFKFNDKRLNKILEKYGFHIRKRNELIKIIKTAEQEQEILEGIRQGKSIADICRSLSFKCSYVTISRFINKKLPAEGKSIKQRRAKRYSKEHCEKLTEEWKKRNSNQMAKAYAPGGKQFGIGKAPKVYIGRGYTGYYKNIFFRSLKELDFMMYLDEKNINWMSGEEIGLKIQYFDETGKSRFYWPDFIVGGVKIVEIKPKYFQTTVRVQKKAEAAKKYCEKNNLTYEFRDSKPNRDKILNAIERGIVKFTSDKLLNIFMKNGSLTELKNKRN